MTTPLRQEREARRKEWGAEGQSVSNAGPDVWFMTEPSLSVEGVQGQRSTMVRNRHCLHTKQGLE